MNKFTRKMMLAIACIVASCINVHAQYQLPNPGFEGTWKETTWGSLFGKSTENVPQYWHSFGTAAGNLQSMTKASVTQSTDTRTGYGHCAQISATNPIGKIVGNGTLTTGRMNAGSATADDETGNYNFTDIENEEYQQKFTGRPDAISFWVKTKIASSTEEARVSAILHDNFRYQDPTKDETILSHKIGSAELNYTTTNEQWVQKTVNFVYTQDITPSFLLLTFTTNKTPGGGSTSDIIYVDDIEFIYNSKLASLKIGGVAVDGFDKDTYTYTITSDAVPTEDQIEAISDGKGATVAKSISGNTVTITVSGNDVSENAGNVHVYTLNFVKDIHVENLAGIYNGTIDIDLSVMGNDPAIMTVPDQVTIEKSAVNELQLTLKNFSFSGMPLGDIVVDKIAVTEDGSNYNMASKEPVSLSLMNGAIQASVSVTGTIYADGTAKATIDVDATGIGKIPVTFNGSLVAEGLRLSALAVSGDGNAITFDPDVFNYKSLAVAPEDILTYTKADPASNVNIVMDGNWIYLNVTNGSKTNTYKLANNDVSKTITAITVNQAIDGNLTLANECEIAGTATVAGTINYTKPIDGSAWNVIGLPYVPTVNVITDNATVQADADWYTYVNENDSYKPQSLGEITNACIMKLRSYNEATAVELISAAGSSIKGEAITIADGYNVCPNNTLTTQTLTDLAEADTYYLFDATAQVFKQVSDPTTATVAPSEMFIALKGSNPVSEIVTPDIYGQGIENKNMTQSIKVYSADGNVFVQGYTGIAEIYLLNGGKVAEKEISDNTTFPLTPNTYIIRTGNQATIVIVK